jgi:hypothetical protein
MKRRQVLKEQPKTSVHTAREVAELMAPSARTVAVQGALLKVLEELKQSIRSHLCLLDLDRVFHRRIKWPRARPEVPEQKMKPTI